MSELRQKIEVVVSDRVLLRFSLIFMLAYSVLLGGCFVGMYPGANLSKGIVFLKHLIWWILVIAVLHEGLHAFVWALFSGKWRKISFGFNRQYLTVYTHCSEPLSKGVYFSGGLAPFVVLSILPAAYAFYARDFYWLCFAIFNGWTCTADLLMCYYLLLLPSKVYVLDHPEKLGFFVISGEQKE